MDLRTLLLLVIGCTASSANLNCKRIGGPTSGEVFCQPRVLNLRHSFTADSVVRARPTTSLTVQCEDSNQDSLLTNRTFAGMSSLESLTLERCRISTLPSVIGHLTQLRSLTIRTFSDDVSLVLESGALNHLKSLQNLEISYSMLNSLPHGVLCNLNSLQSLNVSHNQLQDISDLKLIITTAGNSIDLPRTCKMSELRSLDISFNVLSAMLQDDLTSFPALQQLSARNNRMQLVDEHVLRSVPTLQQLDLSGNQLEVLPAELLQSTPRLTELHLADNQLSALTANMFRRLPRLLMLDLSGNNIGSAWINSETFTALVRLVVLDLSRNRLNQIDTSMFAGLYSLQSLQLQHNQIDSISPYAFEALSSLRTLTLSHNKLYRVDDGILSGLHKLSALSMDNNVLKSIKPAAFKNISGLLELTLGDNELNSLPEAMRYLRQLKVLNLANNFINHLSEQNMPNMSSVENLSMEGNRLTGITEEFMTKLPRLKILNLSRNKISAVAAGSFAVNTLLEGIRLDANDLVHVDGVFCDLPRLRWLNISDNLINRFDYSSLPRGLTWLDLHKNGVSELADSEDIAEDLPIRTLDASFNKLTRVSSLNLPQSVEYLFLNDNLISSVEQYTFFMMSQLKRVDLFANQLTSLEPNMILLKKFNESDTVPKFYIGGNPFFCDCTMEWLLRYNEYVQQRNYPQLMDLDSIYCRLSYNREKNYVPLVEAEASMFLCPYQKHCFTTCTCCAFDACDCEMTCPEQCSCYHDQAWSTNIVDCSNNNFQEIPNGIPMDATEVYLDGNNFKNVSQLTFLGRKNLKVLYLNSSQIAIINNFTFLGLPALQTLHLEDNLLANFTGEEFVGLDKLRELYLDGNRLKHVQNNTFAPLKQLEVLRLSDNQLTDLSVWELQKNPYLVEIGLSGNPWTCACGYLRRFQSWLSTNFKKVSDVGSVQCWFEGEPQGRRLHGSNDTCFEASARVGAPESSTPTLLPLLVSALAAVCLLAALIGLALIYRNELRLWIYSRCGVRVCYRAALDEQQLERPFDAFVSYSQRDASFVHHVLAAKLEHGEPSYRLALHYRDFAHNGYLADTIVEAVQASRRTIMVLSRNFVENEWCRFQFKSAHHEVLKDRQKQLIVVLLGDISQQDLDPDLRLYLRNSFCVHWRDPLFWEKLCLALPDVASYPSEQKDEPHYSEINEGNFYGVSPFITDKFWITR